jgi:TolA-binding protein
MEEAQAESSARLEDLQFVNTQFQFVNSQLISTQQKLKEEVRLANERAEELESERAEMIAKHHEEIRNIYAETSQHLQSDEENLSIGTSLVPAPLLINYCDCGTPVNVWKRRSRRPRRRNRKNRPYSYY